jgi:hypothetical protein
MHRRVRQDLAIDGDLVVLAKLSPQKIGRMSKQSEHAEREPAKASTNLDPSLRIANVRQDLAHAQLACCVEARLRTSVGISHSTMRFDSQRTRSCAVTLETLMIGTAIDV